MCVDGINSLWPGRVTCAEIMINKQWPLATLLEHKLSHEQKNDQTSTASSASTPTLKYPARQYGALQVP